MPVPPPPPIVVVQAQPANIAAAWKAVQCGQRLDLSAGVFPAIKVPARDCSAAPIEVVGTPSDLLGMPATTLEGWKLIAQKGLHFRGVNFRTPNSGNAVLVQDSEDVTFTGGWVTGVEGGVEGKGVSVVRSSRVGVDGVAFQDLAIGLAFSLSQNVWGTNSRFEHMGVDGINVGNSQYVDIAGNHLFGFARLGDKHVDAIQLVSKEGQPATAFVLIHRNRVQGRGQGITGFSPGMSDVDVVENIVDVDSANAIAFNGVVRLRLRNNRVGTLAGASGWGSINVSTSDVIERTGNTQAGAFGKAAKDDPPP